MWTGVLVNYSLLLDFAYVNIKVEIPYLPTLCHCHRRADCTPNGPDLAATAGMAACIR